MLKSKEEIEILEKEAAGKEKEEVNEEAKYTEATYETFAMGESRYFGKVDY